MALLPKALEPAACILIYIPWCQTALPSEEASEKRDEPQQTFLLLHAYGLLL